MKYGSCRGESDHRPSESTAPCLGWHPIREPSNPNTAGLFTRHYRCDWQPSRPLRGLRTSVGARNLSLRVMIRRLIDGTVSYGLGCLKESIKIAFYAGCFSFSLVILSFYSRVIKQHFDNYWPLQLARTPVNLRRSVGLWFLGLYDSGYVSTLLTGSRRT